MPGKKKKAAPKTAAATAADKPVAAAAVARKQPPAAPVIAASQQHQLQQTAAKSEEVANTLATVLNMFPQTHAGIIQSLYKTARGSALIQSIHFQKPFADVKAAFSACDPKRDLNAVDDNGDTALHRAAALDNVDAIKLLLSGGANMRQSNYNGQMPLHLAAFFGRAAAVNEFARRGMDVNATNNQGESALLIAAYFNHRHVIATLLRFNPDAALTDFRGNTALRVAKNDGRTAIQQYVTAKEEAKRRAENPIPGVVTAVVQATKPFTAKLAALKLEAAAPSTASLLATAQGGVAQPATAALSAQRCALSSCGKNDVVLKGCGRCRLVAYCTKEHQIADFKEHKNWCLHVKDVRDNVDAVCDVARPPNERAAATQRLGVPFDSTVIVAVNAIDALLVAIAKETDPKLPALIALRYLLMSGSAVDEDLTARFLLANGLTVVLNALLNSTSVAVTPEAVLDNARFLMAVARRHRLARLIITHYLSAPAAVAAARAANGNATAANGASAGAAAAAAAAPTNPGLTAAQADANVALLCRLTTYGGGGSDRVANLSVGMLSLLCEVDDLHLHSGLSARVAQHCPTESLKLAQRLLKIDALIASKAAAAVSAANTPARNKAATPPPV